MRKYVTFALAIVAMIVVLPLAAFLEGRYM